MFHDHTVKERDPLSMGCPRQEYWWGLPFPTPVDLSDPGIKPSSLVFPALAGGFFTTGATLKGGDLIPSPMKREDPSSNCSMKSESESRSVMSDSLRPHGLYHPGNSPGQNTGVGSFSLLQGTLPKSGIKPRSPALQADSLPAEPQVKPKNTGVGGVSVLQQIFPTQEWNWGLLHCRWILYQLSYEGSP